MIYSTNTMHCNLQYSFLLTKLQTSDRISNTISNTISNNLVPTFASSSSANLQYNLPYNLEYNLQRNLQYNLLTTFASSAFESPIQSRYYVPYWSFSKAKIHRHRPNYRNIYIFARFAVPSFLQASVYSAALSLLMPISNRKSYISLRYDWIEYLFPIWYTFEL